MKSYNVVHTVHICIIYLEQIAIKITGKYDLVGGRCYM